MSLAFSHFPPILFGERLFARATYQIQIGRQCRQSIVLARDDFLCVDPICPQRRRLASANTGTALTSRGFIKVRAA
jgi:hypothetical protein